MNDYYTDETIDWHLDSDQDEDHMAASFDEDNDHEWDYFPPSDDDDERSWQVACTTSDDGDLPLKIKELVDMVHRQPWQITMGKSFYEQARMMADFVDDANIVPFTSYFPTFRDMTVAQMRSYFTIRGMLRKGKFPEVSLSYIFVYIYETLMQIGIDNAEEGYEILREIGLAYATTEPKLTSYLSSWLRDYVVYYNLDQHFAEFFASERQLDAQARVLANYDKEDASTLLDVVCGLSKYDIRRHALFSQHPQEAMEATTDVLRALIPLLEKMEHHKFETFCLGKRVRRQTSMFRAAIFYQPHPVMDAEINVSPRHRYFCKKGMWSKDVFVVTSLGVRSLLGQILREIDFQLRQLLGVKPLLREGVIDDFYRHAILSAVEQWRMKKHAKDMADRREARLRRASIDFGLLGRIRNDAEVVQDKLLDGIDSDELEIGDNKDMDEKPKSLPVELQVNDGKENKNINPSLSNMKELLPKVSLESNPLLSEKAQTENKKAPDMESVEKQFLSLLLSGGDWKTFLRDVHVPEGVMVEGINNRMMDMLGDIVLEDTGQGLQLIEDYREDIEEMIKKDGR